MVRQPLHRADEVIVIITKRRSTGETCDIGCIKKRFVAALQPRPQRRVSQCTAAQFVLLINQDYPLVGPQIRKRSVDSGGTCANDQYIAMGVG